MPIHNQFTHDSDGNLSPAGQAVLGPIFPIEVHVPPDIAKVLADRGEPVPNGVPGIGLIDTGASITCVHEAILQQLGLQATDVVTSLTANGPADQNVYAARIVFPTQGWTLDLEQTLGVNLTGQKVPTQPHPQPVIALLGRNLLSRWVFTYNGPGGFWTVSF